MDGVEARYVYHGVHMLFSGRFMEPWEPGEERCCKLVFIGKDLDHEMLKASFQLCLATPENYERRVANLRFSMGDIVECRIGDDWMKGTVVDHFARDDSMPPGERQPYVIKLMSETEDCVYAPIDDDCVVRVPVEDPASAFQWGTPQNVQVDPYGRPLDAFGRVVGD